MTLWGFPYAPIFATIVLGFLRGVGTDLMRMIGTITLTH